MNSVISDNTTVTNSVTHTLKNTHCIVCGNPFNTARISKLYCSAKCKQYGYYHKEKISNNVSNTVTGINPKPQSFYIEEYSLYDKRIKMLKRYKELKRKDQRRELAENEIRMRQKIGLDVSNYLWDSYTSNQLISDEEDEIYDCENELDEQYFHLNYRELTLEQWSFLKSLYPDNDELSFYRTVSSLGREFIDELNVQPVNPKDRNEHLVIKNRFINHCNLIADGKIKFIQKPEENEKEAHD